MSHALTLAFEITLGYIAFSFTCGGVWIALTETGRWQSEIGAPGGWSDSSAQIRAERDLRSFT